MIRTCFCLVTATMASLFGIATLQGAEIATATISGVAISPGEFQFILGVCGVGAFLFLRRRVIFAVNLLADTESGKNTIEDIVSGGRAGDCINRTERGVEVEQQHFMR